MAIRIWIVTCPVDRAAFHKFTVSEIWRRCSSCVLCGNFLHCLPSAVYAYGNWRWHTTIDEFLQWSEKNGRTSFREKNRIDCSCRNGRCFLCHRDFSIKIYSGCFWNADGIPGLFWNRDGSQCGFIFVHRTGKVPYFLFECDTSGEKSNAAYLW